MLIEGSIATNKTEMSDGMSLLLWTIVGNLEPQLRQNFDSWGTSLPHSGQNLWESVSLSGELCMLVAA